MLVCAKLPAPSPAPRHGRGHGHGRHRGGGVPRRRGPAGGAATRAHGQDGQAGPGRAAGAHERAQNGPAAAQPGRPRRRGGGPAAVVPVLNRKRDGKREESVGKLTGRSIRAGVDRRMGIDGQAELRRERQWRPVVWTPSWPGSGSIGHEMGRRSCGAKLGSSGHEGFERGGEERPEGRAMVLCSRKLEEGDEGKGWEGKLPGRVRG